MEFKVFLYYSLCVIMLILHIVIYAIRPIVSNIVPVYSDSLIYDLSKAPITEISLGCLSGEQVYLGKFPTVSETCISKVKHDTIGYKMMSDEYLFNIKRRNTCGYANSKYSVVIGDYLNNIKNLEITKWRGSDICVKRLEYYPRLTIVPEGSACPGNLKKCLGAVDALNNELCVADDKCPINFIAVVDLNNYSIPETLKDMKLQSFSDGTSFALISGYSDRPIQGYKLKIVTNIGVTEGYPCASTLERSKPFTEASPLYEEFEFYNRCSTKFKNINYNPHVVPIDTNYGYLVLNDNKALNSYATLPYVSDKAFQKRDYVLWVNNFPGVNEKCKQNVNNAVNKFNELYYPSDYFSVPYSYSTETPSFKSYQVYATVIVLLAFISFTFFQHICVQDDNFCFFLYTLFNGLVLLGVFSTSLALCIISFYSKSVMSKFSISGIDLYNKIDEGCFDEYSDWNFRQVNKIVADGIADFNNIGIISIISLIIYVPYGIVQIAIMSDYPD